MPAIQLSTNLKTYHLGFSNATSALGATPDTTLANVPSTDGIVKVKDANLAKLVFYGAFDGADADGKTLTDTRVYTWSPVAAHTWIPTLVGAFNMTLGGAVGVASGTPLATEYFAETITLVDGDESCRIISGIADDIASLTVDLEGAEYLQVVFHNASGTAEAITRNFLYATF
jgi:hypothetical protein